MTAVAAARRCLYGFADNWQVINRRDFFGGAAFGVVGGAALGATVGSGQDAPSAPAAAPPPAAPPPALPEHARLSFAQQGEDILLYHVASELLGIKVPTYLDVGAAYPKRGNNTYLLYTIGARGVLVEPNPALAAMLRAERPGDVVVEAGIGVSDQASADYYEIKGNAMLNTFSRAQVELLQRGKAESVVERVVQMPLVNINRVIQEHGGVAPDLLSTDVEGLDEAIVRSLDLARFRPGAICMETDPPSPSGRPSAMQRYMAAQGYIPRGSSLYNIIYVDVRRS